MSDELLSRITIVEGTAAGAPTVRGFRIRVSDVLDMLAGGASDAEIISDFPFLETFDLEACRLFSSYSYPDLNPVT